MIPENQLMQALRLNRTLALGLVLASGVGLLSDTRLQLWLLLPLAVTALYWAMTEAILRFMKRFREVDPAVKDRLAGSLPWTSAILAGSFLAILPDPILFLLAGVVVLQAQFLGRIRLAWGLFVLYLMAPAALILTGQPLPALALSDWTAWARFVLMALVYFHFGTLVGHNVRQSVERVSKLQSLAATDALTGLINRRQFNLRLQAEVSRARRHRSPLTLALFDIDDFKKLNDFYGHTVGDRILRELGQLLVSNTRESDVTARYGGEEFAIILPETRQMEAYEFLERLRSLVSKTVFCLPDNPLTITISIGLAQFDPQAHTVAEFVNQADAALYEAKRKGKNQVVYGSVVPAKISLTPQAPSP